MTNSNQAQSVNAPKVVDERGPWPFVTRRVLRLADETTRTWSSRHHRKGLLVRTVIESEGLVATVFRWLWCPRELNWWIGTVFAIGSLLFAMASIFSLSPALSMAWGLDYPEINAIFFAGSIPFTTAAYLQLFQAANADEFLGHATETKKRFVLVGWRPGDIGWLSSALQFVGTILFNFNTFDAMLPSLNWFQQDLVIWVPNILGSILFFMSGHLAFIELCHAHWAWNPRSISWWVVFVNLLGCIAFLGSALLALVLPGPEDAEILTLSVALTLIGAVCFLIGSLLMLPEMSYAAEP